MFKKLFSWFSGKASEDNASDKANNNGHSDDQQHTTLQAQNNQANTHSVTDREFTEETQTKAFVDEPDDNSIQSDSVNEKSSECDEQIKPVTETQETFDQSPEAPLSVTKEETFVFAANLTLYTSLDVLQQHGKQTAELPEASISKKEGEWLKAADFALRVDENGMLKSDIGFVKEAEYLAFLRACREVVESNLGYEEKLKDLSAKMEENPLWHSWGQKKLKNKEDWISDLIIKEETRVITGLSLANAKTLFNQGYTSLSAIATAPEEVLTSLPRVGKKTLENIRQAAS
ncbi:helix-hairpin-helix domain-containing protein [Zooshikella ganghwensis]|uniref:Helix-hairpin-helix domain-containing protein n=1 Tax=Zooshikella ganghwensis TaxID=202772 RepID=A0A4P9VJM8_9GAMM|nr:helix-hairpin-helix domain-containing protein [Zooshikella ganghwensis]RDH42719.1 helix-hairpin-helix domain-containing protein [Zooshikella ganghwensis]